MSIVTSRSFRFALTAALVILLVAACSGPEAGSVRTRTADDPSAEATSTPTATQEADEGDPTVGPDPTKPPQEEPAATATTGNPEASPTPAPDPPEAETEVVEPTPTAEPTSTPTVEPSPTHPPDLPAGVLPDNRIVAYYGHPSTGVMGILGEHSKEDALALLREQIAEYEAVDPDTPVIPAFEMIATVAQPDPGPDGTYLAYTGDEWIQEYVDFTAENGMLLFLDLQIGHSTIRDQVALIWEFLHYPHVHVAIDPEFSTGPSHAPGTIIGGVDGNHVNIAIEMLSELAIQNNLPPKILVVHQFDTQMILNKEVITPLPGVDFVLHMDGWGTTEAKVGNYNHFVNNQLIEYGGFKIFYKQDIPVMTASEVLAMPPAPLFISYQ